jgi:hypothetical protein
MTEKLMKLRVPPHTIRWFAAGEHCADSVDGDLFLIDHGTWEDRAIELAQEALLLTEPDLDGFTWCAHTAFRRGEIDSRDALSEMGARGYERRAVYDYRHHLYAVVHFEVSDDLRAISLENDESCEGLEYDWFQYAALALDDLTGAKLACAWGDSIICSTHCTLCLMGLGLFPDREPAVTVPARMAKWVNASNIPKAVAVQIILTPGKAEPNS